MRPNRAWLAAATAVVGATVVAVVISRFWNTIGGGEISLVGWLAMAGGVILTAGLGMGLMALMFFSSRHGWDDAHWDDGENPPPAGGGATGDSSEVRTPPANYR